MKARLAKLGTGQQNVMQMSTAHCGVALHSTAQAGIAQLSMA